MLIHPDHEPSASGPTEQGLECFGEVGQTDFSRGGLQARRLHV